MNVINSGGEASGLAFNLERLRQKAWQIGSRVLLTAGLMLGPEAALLSATEAPAAADQNIELRGPDLMDVLIDEHCEDGNMTALAIYNRNNGPENTLTLKVGGEQDNFHMRNQEKQTRKYPVTAANMPINLKVNNSAGHEASGSYNTSCAYDSSKGIYADGYWLLDGVGRIYPFGAAGTYTTDRRPQSSNYVDIEAAPNSMGYWLTSNLGDVLPYGDAQYYGDRPSLAWNDRVASLSRTPSGKGYWLFTERGRVIPYGDADFFGDMSAQQLNQPVVDSVPTPDGKGYYIVAGDGGVFTFGDARFHGSTGSMRLNRPVVGLVPDPDGDGYWLDASDGGVFAFDAPFRGSMGGTRLNKPMSGMMAYGNGYVMFAEDGGVFNFGNKFRGSLGSDPPDWPVISLAPYDRKVEYTQQ